MTTLRTVLSTAVTGCGEQGRGRGGSQRRTHPLPAHGSPQGPGRAPPQPRRSLTGTVYGFCEGGR